MNKLFLLLLAVGIGATGSVLLHKEVRKSKASALAVVQQWQSATNDLAATQQSVVALQAEVHAKKEQLHQALRHSNISPEMLEILEGGRTNLQSKGWSELRQELGIGWNTSPKYVLVDKTAIKDLWYNKLMYAGSRPSADTVELLGLTKDEQVQLKAALAQAREGQWLNVSSTLPTGDVVAQLTITPPDAAFEQTQSNAFVAGVTAAIGPDRAGLILNDAWREFASDLAPRETETMTIRQTVVDGQPDLVAETIQGTQVSTFPVRYAHYPAFPVLKLFPGGWQAMAKQMNFTLPPSFGPPKSQ